MIKFSNGAGMIFSRNGLAAILAVLLIAAQAWGQESLLSGKTPPPLPLPTGNVVRVYNVEELNTAVANLTAGTTIMIHPGEYKLTKILRIYHVEDVALRGSTGNREDVVIRGLGMDNQAGESSVQHCIYAEKAHRLLVADLTLADAWYHDIHLVSTVSAHIYNVHFLDAGEQLLKINAASDRLIYPDSGLVEYCRFEFSDRGKHWYHNGVDAVAGSYWTIRDNEFLRIRGPIGEMCGPAILFFQGCYGTVAERNLIINCDVGIGLGIFHFAANNARPGEDTYAHRDAIIRNNIIIRDTPEGDAGIMVGYSANYKIYNNTVMLYGDSPRTIIYGDSLSYGEIKNNLTNGPFAAASDQNSLDPWSPSWNGEIPYYEPTRTAGHQSTAVIENNITAAAADMFVDLEGGDIHLLETATAAVNAGISLDDVTDDYDGHSRPVGAAPEIGADETSSQALKGDYNKDGKLNMSDVITLILWYYAGVSGSELDYNGNGKYTIADAVSLLLDIR